MSNLESHKSTTRMKTIVGTKQMKRYLIRCHKWLTYLIREEEDSWRLRLSRIFVLLTLLSDRWTKNYILHWFKTVAKPISNTTLMGFSPDSCQISLLFLRLLCVNFLYMIRKYLRIFKYSRQERYRHGCSAKICTHDLDIVTIRSSIHIFDTDRVCMCWCLYNFGLLYNSIILIMCLFNENYVYRFL